MSVLSPSWLLAMWPALFWRAGGGLAPFVPSDISGLALHMDAQDLSSITEVSGDVSQWDDISGNGVVYSQGVASSQPAYSSTSLNSLPGITLDGVDDVLSSSTSFSGLTELSIFIVARRVSSTGFRCLFHMRPLLVLSTGSSGSNWKNFPGQDDSGADLSAGAGSIIMIAGDNASPGTLKTNGDDAGAVTTAADVIGANAASSSIGANTTVQQSNSVVGEILIYDTVLSASDQDLVEGYLAHRWGLEGVLPAGHPYKTNPP